MRFLWSEEEEEEIDASDEESVEDEEEDEEEEEEEEEADLFLFFFNLKIQLTCEVIFSIRQRFYLENSSALPIVWLRLDCKAWTETGPDLARHFKTSFLYQKN